MTADSTSPARTAVAPVVDYEPPAHASMPCRPTSSPGPCGGSSFGSPSSSLTEPPTSAPPAPPRRGHPPRRQPDRPPRAGLPAPLSSAAVFADAALRRILEVVDGRRPPNHLHRLLATGLAESVLSVRPSATAGRAEPATLQRVRVQPAGSGEPATAVEAFGTYRRGRRTHALACRIERVAETGPVTRTGNPWQIVALHIG